MSALRRFTDYNYSMVLLKNHASTAIIAVAISMWIIATFALIYYINFTFNFILLREAALASVCWSITQSLFSKIFFAIVTEDEPQMARRTGSASEGRTHRNHSSAGH